MDPEGLTWEAAHEVVSMAEAMRRLPPRRLWVDEIRWAEESAQWEAAAQL